MSRLPTARVATMEYLIVIKPWLLLAHLLDLADRLGPTEEETMRWRELN